MDCGICFYGSDDNMPEVLSETTRTARKVYTCCECRSPIQPGEQYEYVWGKWEGDTNTTSTSSVEGRVVATSRSAGTLSVRITTRPAPVRRSTE